MLAEDGLSSRDVMGRAARIIYVVAIKAIHRIE